MHIWFIIIISICDDQHIATRHSCADWARLIDVEHLARCVDVNIQRGREAGDIPA